MRFTKMHGAGNDFIIINNIDGAVPEPALPGLAAGLCAQHVSVGADGMMVVAAPRQGGDFRMIFYNSDGSLGEMCGNGARCIARYGYENGLSGEIQRIETTAGLVTGQRMTKRLYKVRLNDPSVIGLHRSVSAGGAVYDCAYIELGDPGIPHAIVLMPDWDERDRDTLRALGRALRFAKEFPRGANVSFVKIVDSRHVKAITYERGVEDFTLACGTGACASVAAAVSKGFCHSDEPVLVRLYGGVLRIQIDASGRVTMTGPAETIYEGETVE